MLCPKFLKCWKLMYIKNSIFKIYEKLKCRLNCKIKMPRNVVLQLNREVKMPRNSKIVKKPRN